SRKNFRGSVVPRQSTLLSRPLVPITDAPSESSCGSRGLPCQPEKVTRLRKHSRRRRGLCWNLQTRWIDTGLITLQRSCAKPNLKRSMAKNRRDLLQTTDRWFVKRSLRQSRL